MTDSKNYVGELQYAKTVYSIDVWFHFILCRRDD